MSKNHVYAEKITWLLFKLIGLIKFCMVKKLSFTIRVFEKFDSLL